MKNSETESKPATQKKGYTPPKGRPTPKRNDVERAHGTRRGPAKPPETRVEARKRRKELKASLSKEEYKALKNKERAERQAHQRMVQEAIDRGDQRYLLDRDKGEVRAFVRDWVDSRRFLNNFMMPLALVLLVLMLVFQSQPQLAAPVSFGVMVVLLVFFIEGITIGRRANKAARAKFPSTTETGFSLGFYAYSRANQPRRWRSPKPRVALGSHTK
ncbi:DUF3043 domain-containing protein [Corynebacterium sp. 13CS0277]|uniref:DUF3043 domain-containing protein n=1 Tax=Corynebacterium sp. 13CS0277 TaxID=2071994 RepID=UPI000D024355|nr:DUF3043 domain-containing protein [Corynebacterium sp. 13CS0277]PRQ11122.1 DUF3043 domain-containing protein [Corynebacterium sp. 13CS0277]